MNNSNRNQTTPSAETRYVNGRASRSIRTQPFTFWAVGMFSLLLLVASTAFPQQLVGKGRIFIRFTNLRQDDAKVLIRVHVVPNSDKPFGWSGWTVYVGCEEGARNNLGDKWLSCGKQSPWVDIGRGMNLRGTRSPDTYLSPVLCGVETSDNKSGLHLLAEVAEGREQRIIRRIEVHKPELRETTERSYPWILAHVRQLRS